MGYTGADDDHTAPAPDEAGIQTQLVADIQDSTNVLEHLVAGLTNTQAAQIIKLRRAVRLVAVGLALDMALTGGGVWLVQKAYQNSDRITANQQALRNRQAQTAPALCALYDVLLDSYNPHTPSAKAGPASYEASFAQIEYGARVFRCAHTTKGRN